MRTKATPEILRYLKKHHWAVTDANISKARARLRKKKPKEKKDPNAKDLSFRYSVEPWQIIYGRMRVGGVITFVHSVNNNRDLLLVITIAGHEIDAVESLHFGDETVTFSSGVDGWATGKYLNKVYAKVNSGSTSQTAIADLMAAAPDKWTSAHRQRGCAHVYLKLVWDANLFPNGIPEITFTVRGKKVYDPRSATTYWTQNAALCVADYLMDTRYGVGVPLAEIYTNNADGGLYKAADVCDQNVSLIGGGTEPRYQVNGTFDSTNSAQEVIESMAASMAGYVTWVSDKFKFWAGAYRTPLISLDESDCLSGLKVQTLISRRDNFNAIKGTFVSATNNYEETDFPIVRNSYYKTLDNNEEIIETVSLPFTTSASAAQRISKLELERVRQGITVEGLFSLKAYQAETGDNVTLSNSRFGWTDKAFEVVESELVVDEDENDAPVFGCRLVLRETASGVYDWNSGEETRYDVAPNTTLPDPFTVTTPANVTLSSGTADLYLRGDGTVFSRIKVTWDSFTDFFVSSGGKVEIRYKPSSSGSYQYATTIPGDSTFTYILDVQDGVAYDVGVRAISAIGVQSSWVTVANHTVVGKTAPPSDVSGFRAEVSEFGTRLLWNSINDLDLAYYEIRIGDEDDSWDDGVFLAEVRGTSFLREITTADTYRFLIKAVDTSGNYSTTAQYIDVTIGIPTAPSNVTYQIDGLNYSLVWGASTNLFAIDSYEVSYGNDYGTATPVGTTKALIFTVKVNWGGTRRFWIAARDVAGNLGTPASIDILVAVPSAPVGLSSEVIDNNVLLRWTAPTTHTLNLNHYKVYKGDAFDSATLVGQVSGTFAALFEIISGFYTYWVVAVDEAGNSGEASSTRAFVNEPPDFVVTEDTLIDPDSGTYVNVIVQNDIIYAPALNSESWESHFTTNGNTSFQDFIDDGHDYYLQPTPAHGYWYAVIDYGTTLPSSIIKASFVQVNIEGSLAIVTKIAHSLDGSTWTEETASSIYANSFRYVRVRLEFGTLPGATGELMGVLGLTYP